MAKLDTEFSADDSAANQPFFVANSPSLLTWFPVTLRFTDVSRQMDSAQSFHIPCVWRVDFLDSNASHSPGKDGGELTTTPN